MSWSNINHKLGSKNNHQYEFVTKNGQLSCNQVNILWFKIPHSYRLWVLDKDLRAAHLVLIIVHVYRAQQMQDALLFGSTPVWERLRGQNGVPETHTCN